MDRIERFTDIFRAHRLPVMAYVRRRIGAEAAQEIVAETFLAAWRHFDSLPADPLPWLYRAASFEIANYRRRVTRAEQLVARVGRIDTADEIDVAEMVVTASTCRKALAALSDTDREVLLLAAWERLPPAEAAAVLGCSVISYRVRLHRARRHLDDIMGEAPRSSWRAGSSPGTPASRVNSATREPVSPALGVRPIPDAGAVFSSYHHF